MIKVPLPFCQTRTRPTKHKPKLNLMSILDEIHFHIYILCFVITIIWHIQVSKTEWNIRPDRS